MRAHTMSVSTLPREELLWTLSPGDGGKELSDKVGETDSEGLGERGALERTELMFR